MPRLFSRTASSGAISHAGLEHLDRAVGALVAQVELGEIGVGGHEVRVIGDQLGEHRLGLRVLARATTMICDIE